MKRELDEIEAELKGVSVKYRCDHADRCDRHLGKCIAREPHLLHPECATRPEKCPTTEWQVKCIPVEPERVKGRVACATRCLCNDNGFCIKSADGFVSCSRHEWADHTYAQRAGMLERAVATAASDAAYAAGREELARDIWEWWSAEGDCFNDEIVAHFEEWLREKGVM